ncbi:MAG: dGTP triphosphohydrolase, partial [Hyphococcus sp.]
MNIVAEKIEAAAKAEGAARPLAFPAPLAPYAAKAAETRGRLHAEPESALRTPFQRDRDRVIHAVAFRRLKHKTQVFISHEGDHYRTRLTHSLEVAQIARTLARALQLDEDLAECLALAHDLGHPPFGHTGEDVLKACMAPFDGFDHNAQTLRLLTKLERRHASFDGLNLTWETLEGVVKHNGPLAGALAAGNEPLPAAIVEYAENHDLWLDTYPSL